MADMSFSDVHKSYGKVSVIRGIDLSVRDGEFVVIVGPSGCGKSTLLRMIAGLETVTEGEIRIDGVRVNELEPAARDIAMVFQNYALYPHMSVYGNMAYGLKNRGTPKAEIEQRVTAATRMLELEGLLDRKPRQLSGGQRQRVAMGRAIVREPKAFLFDEPLSNLDAKLRVQMRLEIKKLQRRLRTTSIYVTHDQTEAMTMADRLVVLNQGLAEQVGTPEQVYDRPQTRFVAGFIGSPAMNFFDAVIDANGDLTVAGHRVASVCRPTGFAPGPVTAGIRPEHLLIAGDGPFAVTVDMVEPLGAETLLHVRLESNQLTLRLPGKQSFTGDEQIRLAACSDDAWHLFEASSGARLETSLGN